MAPTPVSNVKWDLGRLSPRIRTGSVRRRDTSPLGEGQRVLTALGSFITHRWKCRQPIRRTSSSYRKSCDMTLSFKVWREFSGHYVIMREPLCFLCPPPRRAHPTIWPLSPVRNPPRPLHLSYPTRVLLQPEGLIFCCMSRKALTL